MGEKFFLTGNERADELVAKDPLALIIGMVLDQQVPIEWAFSAPAELHARLGERWSVHAIATMAEEELVAAFCAKPALHRYPASMARRVGALCAAIESGYQGDVAALWTTASSGAELLGRLRALPGFGAEKAKIFIALLGKRFGAGPPGWQEACAPFDDGEPRTVADIRSPETLAAVRAWKRAAKSAGRTKSDRVATSPPS